MQWSEADLDTLKAMWVRGDTAGQIASAIGQGITRSAVLGKVHRLKLEHGKPSGSKPARPKGEGHGRGFRIAKARAEKMSLPAAMELVLGRPSVPFVEREEPGVDVTHLLGLVDLHSTSCRWPVGDPLEPAFGFCGRPIVDGKTINEEPYCGQHKRRAAPG